MKAKLRSVNTHFWNDTWVCELDPIEKLLFLYLITNDQVNISGAYEISLRRIAFDTGIDREMVNKILMRFEEKKRVAYVDGYVVLRKFAQNQRYNANMLTGAMQSIEELPENVLNHDLCEGLVNDLKGLERVSKPSENKKEEKGKKKGKKEDEKGSETFDTFWKLYDYKKDRSRCETKWNNLTQKQRDEAIKAAPAYVASTPDTKFRKHPHTWLNGECWNDEIIPTKKETKQEYQPVGLECLYR